MITDSSSFVIRYSLFVIRHSSLICPLAQTWIGATTYYTKENNGLYKSWFGRVWLNPPYGGQTGQWTGKAIAEYEANNLQEAIILVRPAIGSGWYQDLSKRYPRCEPDKRIRFLNAQGELQTSPVHGNTFFYLGENIEKFQQVFSQIGAVVVPYRQIID